MRGARGSDAGASADGSAADADASPERLEASRRAGGSRGFGWEKSGSGDESEDRWGGSASSSGGSSSEISDGSEDGSEDADARRARDSRTPTPTRDPPRDARRHVMFAEPDTTASETDRGPSADVRGTGGQPRSFWDSVVSDGFASLGCGPLMGAGMEDDSPRRSSGRRPRRRERGGVRPLTRDPSDQEVTDDDVMLDLLGEGPSRAARRALLRGDDANGLAGYYDGDDAAYESELERRRALRKSLRDGTCLLYTSPSPRDS